MRQSPSWHIVQNDGGRRPAAGCSHSSHPDSKACVGLHWVWKANSLCRIAAGMEGRLLHLQNVRRIVGCGMQ
jgi:hypothetical protein